MPAPAPPDIAPEAWEPARRMADRVLGPLDRFLHVEAASGIVLLLAALIGLGWANSPWGDSYDALWHTTITLGLGSLLFEQTLHFWINDGLMTIFFFVVGLEIRREMHGGELSEVKKAVLPIAAAIGGMVAPALIFLALNGSGEPRRGFGVPMATDIAFAVGVLALLGKRVPSALRVLLLALAIIDDVGAIVVIAVFYSGGLKLVGLLVACGAVGAVVLFQRFGVRKPLAYVLPGAVLWSGMLHAGVHPTMAGVILGMLTPVRAWFGEKGFVSATRDALDKFDERKRQEGRGMHDLLRPLHDIRRAHREALPPVVRIEAELHGWVAFGVMPLFALANAGVDLSGFDHADQDALRVLFGVFFGLLAGKPIGILLASLGAVRLGLCRLPAGVSFRGVTVVGLVAGIGFTMAIFIAGLAFSRTELLAAAKLGVLLASASAAVAGLAAGTLLLETGSIVGAAATAEDAEAAVDT